MAYPEQSTTRAGTPGALWWVVIGNDGTRYLWATQWDVLMKRFQQRAQRMIPPLFAFPASGDCHSIVQVATANIRRRDKITIDGVFGPQSRDLLGWLLCAAGDSQLAQQLAQETARGVVSAQTVHSLILFANHVSSVGTPDQPDVEIDVSPRNVILPPDLLPPTWNQRTVSNSMDQDWQVAWIEGQPIPRAPSQGGGVTPSNEITLPTINVGPTTQTPAQPPANVAPLTTAATPWWERQETKAGAVILVFIASIAVAASMNPQRRARAHT